MDVSELRKRILRALDEANRDVSASARRQANDAASTDYETFLSDVARPLFLQAANVLRAAGHQFTASTPAGSVKLTADWAPAEFLELELDKSGRTPQVLGRTSRRDKEGQIVDERPLAPGKAIANLTDDDVTTFLIAELPRLVSKQ